MYWMYRLVAPPGIRKHLLRVVKRFYGSWLHLSGEPHEYSYNIVLEDSGEQAIIHSDVSTVIARAPWHSLRDTDIVALIERARAYFRNHVTWDHTSLSYRIDGVGGELPGLDPLPAYDVFLLRGHPARLVSDVAECSADTVFLAVKMYSGRHLVYSGPRPVAVLNIPDHGEAVEAKALGNGGCIALDINRVAEANHGTMNRLMDIARRFLHSLGDPDVVAVSFSGGKDSLVVLDLALEVFGRDRVKPIYVDTGVDLPSMASYIDTVEAFYGIRVTRVYAGVREAIASKGFPTVSNRWCTLLKTMAFKKTIKSLRERYRRVLVLVGDRDTESARRSHKPPVRRRPGYLEAAPIKQWGTLHVQLYIALRRLPENPMYRLGFYRLGCYICPAMRSLERLLVKKYLGEALSGDDIWKHYRRTIMGGEQ